MAGYRAGQSTILTILLSCAHPGRCWAKVRVTSHQRARPLKYNRGVAVPFEIIEHPADVGFRAWGRTREEMFAHAALAMMTLACELEGLEERERREIESTGADDESLLYGWLAEILAVQDAEQMFFHRAEVTYLSPAGTPGQVRGRMYGERYDRQRHRAGTYIKAVTMHQLRVEQTPEGWRAQVYLDV